MEPNTRILYYWSRTEGFFIVGVEQKDSLLLEPNKRILDKDSLLLAQNRRILYYWRRRGGNFGISSVRQPLIQISAKSTNSRKKPLESGEGNIFGFPGFEGHWSRFQQQKTQRAVMKINLGSSDVVARLLSTISVQLASSTSRISALTDH